MTKFNPGMDEDASEQRDDQLDRCIRERLVARERRSRQTIDVSMVRGHPAAGQT